MEKKKGMQGKGTEHFDWRAQHEGLQDPDGPLTAQQKEFVKNIAHHGMKPALAAQTAGYLHSDVNAYRMMRNPKIKKAISIEQEAYAKASEMTKKKVIDGFIEAIDLARIKGEPVAMIAGWREVGKMCGFYEPKKVDIKVSMQGQVLLQRLNSMSDQELLAMAEEDANVLEGEFDVVGE